MSEPSAEPVETRGLVHLVVTIERSLCGLLIVAMALLTAAEVVCRSFLGFSLLINDEISGYLLVAISFLGLGVALGEGALFRVGFVYDRLSEGARTVANLVFDICSLLVGSVILQQMVRLAWSSYERGVTAPTMLRTPLYLPQLTMVVGAFFLVLILLARIVAEVRDLLGRPT